jgi:hypothetical protein
MLMHVKKMFSSQGERGEPSERFVQPMGREGTDTEFSQKRNAGFNFEPVCYSRKLILQQQQM